MSAEIREPGEGIRTIDLAGTTVTPKTDGGSTGDAFVVAEATLAPGGFAPPLHLHREIAAALHILRGGRAARPAEYGNGRTGRDGGVARDHRARQWRLTSSARSCARRGSRSLPTLPPDSASSGGPSQPSATGAPSSDRSEAASLSSAAV